MKQIMKNNNWDLVENQNNVESAYDEFKKVFMPQYTSTFPTTTKVVKPKEILNKWMTAGLVRASKKKQKLYIKFLKNKTFQKEQKYKKYAKIFERAKEMAKKQYYSNVMVKHQHNLKESWKVMKEIISKKPTFRKFPAELQIDEKTITDPQKIANTFNDFFAKIGPNLAKKIGEANYCFKDYLHNAGHCFRFDDINRNELKEAFEQLKLHKSPGIDNVSVDVVFFLFEELYTPLNHIFQLSLKSGTFPSDFKKSKIIPAFKEGSATEVGNYRPISVLLVFSKILERIVYERLYRYFESRDLFFNKQFGFKKKTSIDYAILDLVQSIQTGFSKKDYTLGVFIDFSKAFDTVNHEILLEKLASYGIKGIELKWFHSYLKDRYQCVAYNDMLTDFLPITCGVPQGSILGPLLFLIYVNDMFRSISKLDMIMFADDTNLFITGSNIKSLFKIMNEQLERINEWFKANKLSLNIKKTKYTFFCSHLDEDEIPLKLPNLEINQSIIHRVRTTKFLGVYIDENLNWKKHISILENKIAKNIGIIAKARKYLNDTAMKGLYFAFVHPYLIFGNIAWASGPKATLKKTYSLQKRAVRIISYTPKQDNVLPIFKTKKILSVYEINIFAVLNFMYRHQMMALPTPCLLYFDIISHSHNTRLSRSGFDQGFACRQVSTFNIVYRGPRLWNSINITEIKLCNDIELFKKKCKKFLLNEHVGNLW